MMISTKGRYALRAMIDIAEHNTGAYIPLKDIARRQEISEKYLEGILPVLTKAGYLDGLRGKGGGYKLTRPAESYNMLEILTLMEGALIPVACLDDLPNKCMRAPECRTLPLWQGLKDVIDTYLEGITLADLCNTTSNAGDYSI